MEFDDTTIQLIVGKLFGLESALEFIVDNLQDKTTSELSEKYLQDKKIVQQNPDVIWELLNEGPNWENQHHVKVYPQTGWNDNLKQWSRKETVLIGMPIKGVVASLGSDGDFEYHQLDLGKTFETLGKLMGPGVALHIGGTVWGSVARNTSG